MACGQGFGPTCIERRHADLVDRSRRNLNNGVPNRSADAGSSSRKPFAAYNLRAPVRNGVVSKQIASSPVRLAYSTTAARSALPVPRL